MSPRRDGCPLSATGGISPRPSLLRDATAQKRGLSPRYDRVVPVIRIDPFGSLSGGDRELLRRMWANGKVSAARRSRNVDVDAEAEAWYREDLVVYVYEDGHRVIAPRSTTVGVGDSPGSIGWHMGMEEYVLGVGDGSGGRIAAAKQLVLESDLDD